MRKRHQSANYKQPSGLHWPATEFANDDVSRPASRSGADRQAEPPILPRDGAESDRWSPSQEELDAYIDSLEWELSREYPPILRHQGENRGAAARGVRQANSWGLFLPVIAVVLGCFAWLLETIYEAFK